MTVHQMKDYRGHLVVLQMGDPRFGPTWRAVCLEEGCGYQSCLAGKRRAGDIAEEHRRKSLGEWRPER